MRSPLDFWEKVDQSGGANACWPWMGARSVKGYGNTSIGTRGRPGFEHGAHRVAWVRTYGPIPDGLWVLHRCDNPPCCNPKHLRLGDNGENQREAYAKGRKAPPIGIRLGGG